jgi:hypothetical protein
MIHLMECALCLSSGMTTPRSVPLNGGPRIVRNPEADPCPKLEPALSRRPGGPRILRAVACSSADVLVDHRDQARHAEPQIYLQESNPGRIKWSVGQQIPQLPLSEDTMMSRRCEAPA